jgi:hypothetical protein
MSQARNRDYCGRYVLFHGTHGPQSHHCSVTIILDASTSQHPHPAPHFLLPDFFQSLIAFGSESYFRLTFHTQFIADMATLKLISLALLGTSFAMPTTPNKRQDPLDIYKTLSCTPEIIDLGKSPSSQWDAAMEGVALQDFNKY